MSSQDDKIGTDCPERVAFDLMILIAGKEENRLPDPRTYYLTLFKQCHKAAVCGRTLKDILTQE